MQKKIGTLFMVFLVWMTFRGLQAQPAKDIDGNVYKTVTIGTQVWMAENLKTTKYSDGTEILHVTKDTMWMKLTIPAYCWYNNKDSYKDTYGALYNWFTTNLVYNGGKNICPNGWHVPTNEEWGILITFLSNIGYGFEGSKREIAKSMAATSGWQPHDITGNVGNHQPSNNSSGFTALPGGYRNFLGTFNYIGKYSYWWSSTESSNTNAYYRFMHNYYSYVGKANFSKQNGFCIRCLRDF
jgi:uncharacterized protein (TIGR02145 family)